jgi:hypothetical protein
MQKLSYRGTSAFFCKKSLRDRKSNCSLVYLPCLPVLSVSILSVDRSSLVPARSFRRPRPHPHVHPPGAVTSRAGEAFGDRAYTHMCVRSSVVPERSFRRSRPHPPAAETLRALKEKADQLRLRLSGASSFSAAATTVATFHDADTSIGSSLSRRVWRGGVTARPLCEPFWGRQEY